MARIEQAIEVNVPLRAAYNQWTQFRDFPRFMEGVREVRQIDDAHVHWKAVRNGLEVEWDSEIIEQVPDQRIAWRDTDGPCNSGAVTFQPVDANWTRVLISMELDTSSPMHTEGMVAQRLGQDLARFKQLVEEQGAESGAWRGEIHDARPVRPGDQAPSGADAAAGARAYAGADSRADSGTEASGARSGESAPSRAGGAQAWLRSQFQGWEDPMVLMRKMSDEMDQLFERFIGRPVASRLGQGGMSGKWMPPVEVSQRDGQLVIGIDLPGVKREDVQIEIAGDKLTIEGERREDSPQAAPSGYRRSERTYGQFFRTIPLPEGVDPDAGQASMRDGVLEITLPMPAVSSRRGRRIDIRQQP